jgi:hypothetical protein
MELQGEKEKEFSVSLKDFFGVKNWENTSGEYSDEV